MATVLLVEDDPAARQGLELALRRLGYGVHAAETGEAALATSATPPRTSWCST
jgi:Response regulator containing CheY-like receiver, AAA-type ATPase, and DNA-binding domains